MHPLEFEGKRPGVVVLHSTVRHTIRQPAGVEGKPEKAFGLKLARRGYVAICPRCFLWTSDLSTSYQQHVDAFRARHPKSRGMARMLYDAVAAVDILAALPEVDVDRLGAVGHSLGAKEVPLPGCIRPTNSGRQSVAKEESARPVPIGMQRGTLGRRFGKHRSTVNITNCWLWPRRGRFC